MGYSTGVRHGRQEVSSTVSSRVKGSSPARGKFFAEFFFCNTILASMPEWSIYGKTRMQSEILNVLTTIHSFSSKQWMTQRQCVYELSHWHNTQIICVKHVKNSWMIISSVRISYPAECNCHLLYRMTPESYLFSSIVAFVYKPM